MKPDFYIGETWIIPGKAKDYNGQPLNLTGATVRFILSVSTGIIATLDNNSNVQITDAVNGEYRVNVPPSLQASWDPTWAYVNYQVEIELSNGVVSVQDSGYFRVTASAARRFASGA